MISWFGMMALVALLYVLVSGLANPRTRPFIIGLGAFFGMMVLLFVGLHDVRSRIRVPEMRAQVQQEQAQIRAQVQQQQAQSRAQVQQQQAQSKAWLQDQARRVQDLARMFPAPPAPSPPKTSATETKRPKMGVVAALVQAIVQAWPVHASIPAAVVAEKPEKASPADLPPKPGPPGWVNAPPKMDDHCYQMSVHAGPYTTPLECERELHKSLQGAAADYAELSLGPDAAGVRLPDDDLQQLVHDRWNEVQSMEIGGSSQDMFTLHALLVFDAAAQQRIKDAVQQMKTEAQRLMIDQRVQDAAVVFGGVLGLLALTWGGLKWATVRQDPERKKGQEGHQGQQGEPGEQKRAARSFPGFFLAVILVLSFLFVLGVVYVL